MKNSLSRSMEDYMEAILILKKEGKNRVRDVAEFLEVTLPSVVSALSQLKDKQLVVQKKYGRIELTPKGDRVARAIYKRHLAIASFLEFLGVSCSIAQEDACKMEHDLHSETMKRIACFMDFVDQLPSEIRQRWNHFLKTRIENNSDDDV